MLVESGPMALEFLAFLMACRISCGVKIGQFIIVRFLTFLVNWRILRIDLCGWIVVKLLFKLLAMAMFDVTGWPLKSIELFGIAVSLISRDLSVVQNLRSLYLRDSENSLQRSCLSLHMAVLISVLIRAISADCGLVWRVKFLRLISVRISVGRQGL